MKIKQMWNKLINTLQLGKTMKIRPDNLALFSTKKIFEGNSNKAESYLLREGMDSIGLKLVLIPEKPEKTQEMINLAIETSDHMKAKQIQKIESLLFGFLYEKSSTNISKKIETALKDFSILLITAYKFAESNERSVESTYFVFIIATPSFSVVKDILVIIGLVTLYLPLLYWGLLIRISKNIGKIKTYFKGKSKAHYIELFTDMSVNVLLNLILFFGLIACLNFIFVQQAESNTDFCYKNRMFDDWNEPQLPVQNELNLVGFLSQIKATFNSNLSFELSDFHFKMVIFSMVFVLINLLIKILKAFINSNFKKKISDIVWNSHFEKQY